MKNKCLIFDMDGTLVDSKKNITSSVNHTREALGLKPISEDMIYEYINIPGENLALRFYNQESFDDKTKKIFYEHYINECTKNLKVYGGIRDLLEYMQQAKVKMAIATNAYDVFAKKIAKECDLEKYFDLIVGANTVNSSKPDAKIAKFILNELQVKSQDSILIGDSQKDEMCAKNANTHFIYVSWGYGYYKSHEDFTSKKPSDLKEKILQIFNC